ncbi:hypothetical protein, partial [Escherichia coli]|uniref:hypothetical protein n=1 Tax=Escherichia coli TaxID=562 RepID=UPI0024DF1B90
GWAILLRQKQKKLIMLPSETMIWQPEFTDKTLSRKIGAVQTSCRFNCSACAEPHSPHHKIHFKKGGHQQSANRYPPRVTHSNVVIHNRKRTVEEI